jgi:hypothetical protein
LDATLSVLLSWNGLNAYSTVSAINWSFKLTVELIKFVGDIFTNVYCYFFIPVVAGIARILSLLYRICLYDIMRVWIATSV